MEVLVVLGVAGALVGVWKAVISFQWMLRGPRARLVGVLSPELGFLGETRFPFPSISGMGSTIHRAA